MSTTFEQIPTDLIRPHDRNVRRDLGNLDELAASIKGMGVLQPLIVAQINGDPVADYVLIAGHRRHAAAVKAGLDTVPCVIRTDLDNQAKVIEAMLVENLQRTDLTVMEEADAYAQLELLGVKEAAIAKSTGRSRATVHQRLLLAALPTERREQYEGNTLSLDGAVKCAKLRAQHADDSEILTAIDDASTWAFGSGSYGIDRTIQRILEDRQRAANPEPEDDEDDEGTIDYAAKRAEQEAGVGEVPGRSARRAVSPSRRRVTACMTGCPAASRPAMRCSSNACWMSPSSPAYYDRDADRFLPLMGIEPPGDDEDVDDANARVAREAKALSHFDKVLLLALSVSEVASEYAYVPDYARTMADLGVRAHGRRQGRARRWRRCRVSASGRSAPSTRYRPHAAQPYQRRRRTPPCAPNDAERQTSRTIWRDWATWWSRRDGSATTPGTPPSSWRTECERLRGRPSQSAPARPRARVHPARPPRHPQPRTGRGFVMPTMDAGRRGSGQRIHVRPDTDTPAEDGRPWRIRCDPVPASSPTRPRSAPPRTTSTPTSDSTARRHRDPRRPRLPAVRVPRQRLPRALLGGPREAFGGRAVHVRRAWMGRAAMILHPQGVRAEIGCTATDCGRRRRLSTPIEAG